MKSIKELYRIGTGPSSSHTMGPRKAAEMFLTRHPEAASFKVTLYGSLAATGKGHMTDVAIIDTLKPTASQERCKYINAGGWESGSHRYKLIFHLTGYSSYSSFFMPNRLP